MLSFLFFYLKKNINFVGGWEASLRSLEGLVCLFFFYFLSGCLNAVDDAGELLVLLLLPP